MSTALREALCREPETGEAALLRLADSGRLDKAVRTMREADCRVVLGTLCDRQPASQEVTIEHLHVAWRAWQRAQGLVREQALQHHNALQIYLTIRHNDESPPPSVALHDAIRAVTALASWMGSTQSDSLLMALRRNDTAAALTILREEDVESLNVLLRCERVAVVEIAEELRTTASRSVETSADSREPLFTPFGGIFYLLPHLDDLDLHECAAALPDFEGEAPAAVVRFLVLLKCLGASRAPRAFFDPILREVAGLTSPFDADAVRAWARFVTPQMADDFQARWATSCLRRVAMNTSLALRSPGTTRPIASAHRLRTRHLALLGTFHAGTGPFPGGKTATRTPRCTWHFLCDPALVSMLPGPSREFRCLLGTHPKRRNTRRKIPHWRPSLPALVRPTKI